MAYTGISLLIFFNIKSPLYLIITLLHLKKLLSWMSVQENTACHYTLFHLWNCRKNILIQELLYFNIQLRNTVITVSNLQDQWHILIVKTWHTEIHTFKGCKCSPFVTLLLPFSYSRTHCVTHYNFSPQSRKCM